MSHTKRLSILLTFVVIGGMLWFMKFGSVPTPPENFPQTAPSMMGAPAAGPLPESLTGPLLDEFEIFTVPGEETILRTLTCEDAFYVVLVFPRGADYRTDPRSAVYNSATACAKGESVEVRLATATLNIIPGDYYLLVADQGVSGSWYNPR